MTYPEKKKKREETEPSISAYYSKPIIIIWFVAIAFWIMPIVMYFSVLISLGYIQNFTLTIGLGFVLGIVLTTWITKFILRTFSSIRQRTNK